jgi:acetyl esterase/lipase
MSVSDTNKPRSPSWQARFWRHTTSWYVGLFDAKSVDVVSTRKRLDVVANMVPTASGVTVEKATIAGLDAEWLTPDAALDRKLLLYWHGGAYVMGSCKSHRPLVSHIARAAGMRALLPEYRLAPEHPFPAAIEDAVAVYKALLADGYDPKDIAVAGDSAGGGLTIAMLLSLREARIPLPAVVALMSPWLDLTGNGETMSTRKDNDPLFSPEDIPHVVKYYCDESQRRDPRVSPVFADVSNLPATLIQVGNDEILLSDSQRFADKIRASNGEVELDVWPGMWHVWQMFIGFMPESKAAVNQLANYIRGAIA